MDSASMKDQFCPAARAACRAFMPVVWQIELDEDLANSKVIAEAWDAAGLVCIR